MSSYLQQTPAEVEALFRDLLIGVTNFFRDPEAFAVLEQAAVPRLFAGKPPAAWSASGSPAAPPAKRPIRSPSCCRSAWKCSSSYTVQVFATDIDSRAIATARPACTRPASPPTSRPSGWPVFSRRAGWRQSYRIHKEHPRHAGVLRAGRDQGPAVLRWT
jgi:two-component system CheB/CheR fusion protein